MPQDNIKTTWDLSSLYLSDNDPNIAKDAKIVTTKNEIFAKKWQKRTDYLTNPAVLKEALDDFEKLARYTGNSGKIGFYLGLRSSLDMLDTNLKAKENKINDLATKNYTLIQFFFHNVAEINPQLQHQFLNYPPLLEYKHLLEEAFVSARYLLSEPEERVLVLLSKTSLSNWIEITEEFLSKEMREVPTSSGKKKLSFEEIFSLLNNPNKEIRDSAAAALNDIFEKNVDLAVHELNSVLQHKKVVDELRGYKRPDLERHLADDIDTRVVDTLISAVSGKNNLASRYYQLKAEILGVQKLAFHERNLSIGEVDKAYSFIEAVGLVRKVFNNLDKEFGSILDAYLKNGQIDVYPKQGKRGGAFCTHDLKDQPSFVMLNFTDQLRDASTLAHEMGHAINSEFSKKTQNSLNMHNPTSTAEVASTFMEDFVFQELLQGADSETKLAIIMTKLNDDVSTIFRQIALYRFEQEMHQEFREKGFLSKEDLGNLFQKHMSSYMGEYVMQPESAKNWWVYWSHIRMFFYVYSYASGLLISKSLQSYVKEDPRFINNVKKFLSAGSSSSPQTILQEVGVDISDPLFWNRGLGEVEDLLKEATLLAKKLGKIS